MALTTTCRLSSAGSITARIEVSLSTACILRLWAGCCLPTRPPRYGPPCVGTQGNCVTGPASGRSYFRPMAANELQALLEAAVDGIVMIDHRGRITAFN